MSLLVLLSMISLTGCASLLEMLDNSFYERCTPSEIEPTGLSLDRTLSYYPLSQLEQKLLSSQNEYFKVFSLPLSYRAFAITAPNMSDESMVVLLPKRGFSHLKVPYGSDTEATYSELELRVPFQPSGDYRGIELLLEKLQNDEVVPEAFLTTDLRSDILATVEFVHQKQLELQELRESEQIAPSAMLTTEDSEDEAAANPGEQPLPMPKFRCRDTFATETEEQIMVSYREGNGYVLINVIFFEESLEESI